MKKVIMVKLGVSFNLKNDYISFEQELEQWKEYILTAMLQQLWIPL